VSLLPLFLLVASMALFGAGPADLLTAVRAGDRAQVQKLLRANVDANSADAEGTTALMHAVVEADAATVKILLDAGANPNTANAAGSTALMGLRESSRTARGSPNR